MAKSSTVGDITKRCNSCLLVCGSKSEFRYINKTETICYDSQEKAILFEFYYSNLVAVCANVFLSIVYKVLFCVVLLCFATFKVSAIRERRLCKVNVETGLSIKWPHVEQ